MHPSDHSVYYNMGLRKHCGVSYPAIIYNFQFKVFKIRYNAQIIYFSSLNKTLNS